MKSKALLKSLILFTQVIIFISLVRAEGVNVYVDKEIKPVILRLIYETDKTIDIQMYILSDQDVIEALERAEDRGVEVRIILDPSRRYNLKYIDELRREGVEIKWYPVNKPALMHRKLAIFDREKILLGSANWSRNGLTNNKEITVLIDDIRTVDRVADIFSDDWYHSFLGHYSKY
jgi:phosphatidylserine/phosphatidylglycerophosphate/cardiolipin synthase-like enzyme